MGKTIIVSTRSSQYFNDNQHDCAGTWTVVASKNERAQIKAAEEIDYLVHRRDGEIVAAYKVAGFHTERRDMIFRQGTPRFPESQPKISVGVRFHLRMADEATEAYLIDGANRFLNDGGLVQGCSVIEL